MTKGGGPRSHLLAWGMIRSKSIRCSVLEKWCRHLSSLEGASEQRKSAVSTVTASARQALLEEYLAHPSELWNNRTNKKGPNYFNSYSNSKKPLLGDPQHAWAEGKLRYAEYVGVCAAPNSHALDYGAKHEKSERVEIGEWTSTVEALSKLCKQGELADAVEVLELVLQRTSYVPSSLLYSVLKRCIAQNDLALGRRVHALAYKSGYESNTFLANHIIRMYGSHGMLTEATQVFKNLAAPDTFSWCFIIKANSEHGRHLQAIRLFRLMRQSAMRPNNHTFVAVLKACAGAADLAAGKEVHADILGSEVEPDLFVGNCLVYMYSKCGSLEDARKVFDTLHRRDDVTWNAMIGGYAQHGMGEKALGLYADMEKAGIVPSSRVTFLCLLKACSSAGALQMGKGIHSKIKDIGLEADVFIGSSLVDMYARCGSLDEARRVFDNLPTRNVVTWNCMITGYVQHGRSQEALILYENMQQKGIILADGVTFVSLLKACGSMGALHEGKQLHAQIRKKGLEDDVAVGNCLVDMYAKCGSLEYARRVFDKLPSKDVVTWNTMITGYVQERMSQEALALYAGMQQQSMTPADRFTFVSLLKACSSDGAIQLGKQLHSQIQEKGLEADVFVGSSLVDMYAKCGRLEDARKVFDNLPTRNVVTWNCMISAYAQEGLGQEALAMYASMQQNGVVLADVVTYVCLLKACASVGALYQGKQLHAQIQETGLATDVFIGNALVDMYTKCASLDDARSVFDNLQAKNVVTWNSLLNGYAQHSNGKVAMDFFEEMCQQAVVPDDVTFNCLLVACGREGLVDEGQRYFTMMMENYRMTPDIYHYTCMVDLFARSGRLDDAEKFLQAMPSQSDVGIWTSLLSACKSHGNTELGRRCFDQIVQLEPHNSSAYVLLASIYANAGRWSDVEKLESLRKSAGALKKPAKATIEVHSKVHTFTVGEGRDDISCKIRSVNLHLKEEGGHVPHTQLVLKAVSEKDKEDALCGHAEKLALAYGLLNTPDGTTLLVTKNLRMCNDCHSGTKIMSKLEKREIIVRDSHRVHRFTNGSCSCGDRH